MNDTLNILLEVIRTAGEAVLKLQKSGFYVEKKANHDLVTEADYLANEILQNKLLGKYPQDGWLSEESVLDKKRLSSERTWIVDPIDGTKEFASGIAEYAISVALIEKGAPILAAIYNPATDELFHAIKNEGAFLNGMKIHCRPSLDSQQLCILASRSEYARGEWKIYENDHQIKQMGSIAYKLGLIAAGKADATFSLSPKNEWDIAAGVLLVKEAGGIVTDKQKQLFVFNRENVLVNGIQASSKAAMTQVFSLINLVDVSEEDQ